ncbi:MAG: Uma2 family endonuclease [Myxococcota bacterium]
MSGSNSNNPHVPPEPTWDVAMLFPSQGAWSEEEYLALTSNRLVEFSHGHLEIPPMPTDSHQAIVAFLYTALAGFVAQTGWVRFAPLRLRLWPGKFREPDILFLSREHGDKRGEQYWEAADLVIEVVSADDPRRDTVTKRREYAKAAIPEYWIVDPMQRTIQVLTLENDTYALHGTFGASDHATSVLLPGFAIDVGAALNHE